MVFPTNLFLSLGMMAFSKRSLLVAAITLGSVVQPTRSLQPYAESYAPAYVQCPSDIQWIRPASGLSQAEAEWVQGRKRVVGTALGEYLQRLQIENFDVSQYLSHMDNCNYDDVPIMGLAISGGGWASAYTGTAAMRALDSRLDAAVKQRTGGLLQCITYMSGLSGGGFPTVSFAVNNFPTADEIVDVWQPAINRFGVNTTTEYAASFTDMFEDIHAKVEAGFPVGTADLFGRAWGYQFTPGYKGGLNVTLSSIVNESNFVNHQMPFPILQTIELTDADVKLFGLEVPFANDTTYDMTPFEFGAWGGSASSFVPTQYLGTKLNNGVPVNESACVVGFDRASFMIGASAAAFNFWEIEIESNGTLASFSKSKRSRTTNKQPRKREEIIPPSEASAISGAFESIFNLTIPEIAYAQIPNPFVGVPSASPYTQTAPYLNMVDGSEGGQTIPLWGQIQPARASNFIIAWEDTNDAPPYGWNNGTNIYHTYQQASAAGLPFPIVPPFSTFIHQKWFERPVFFGCDKRLTTTGDSRSPIVLYLAHAPYSAYLNFTADQGVMSPQQMDDIFLNGFNQLTQGNGTLDHEWPICLGCAAIERSLEKAGMDTPEQCRRCFKKYCWDGNVMDEKEVGVVNPTLVLDHKLGYLEWLAEHEYWNATLSSQA